MTCQEDSNGYQLPAHPNPLLPASRKADGQGRELVRGSSGLYGHPWLSYLNGDQTSRHPVFSRRHHRLGGGRVRDGSTRVQVPGRTHLGLLQIRSTSSSEPNQRSTTCVVPPVAAAAERPPGADAACTSTPSCPGSPPRSDAPATQRTSGPCGGSRGAKAEAPETGPQTPASRIAATSVRRHRMGRRRRRGWWANQQTLAPPPAADWQ